MWRLRRRRRQVSPRIRLLELAIAARQASTRLGLLANRIWRTYMRTRDPSLTSMLEKILALQAVLEIMAVRLETLAEVGVVSSESLSLVKQVLREAREVFGDLGPSVSGLLTELDNMVTSIAAETGYELPPPSEVSTQLSEEAKKVLEEAKTIAEERLGEMSGNTA